MPQPHRRCIHLDERGSQCETWFPATDDNRLCEMHREIASPGKRNGESKEQNVKFMDLLNDERVYCYHFQNGESQNQDKELIFQFKDDKDGSKIDKIDRRIAFLESVLTDIKTRFSSARAVRGEALDALTEEERKERRKIKIEKAVTETRQKITATMKTDPIGYLANKGISRDNAKKFLMGDADAMIAKYEQAKRDRENLRDALREDPENEGEASQ